jgi:hypothetical protein
VLIAASSSRISSKLSGSRAIKMRTNNLRFGHYGEYPSGDFAF